MRALNPQLLVAWALAGLVFVTGSWIPLPSLVLGADGMFEATVGTSRLWSVLALGLQPVLSVLVVVELSKLLVPRFRRWTAELRDGLLQPRTAIAALALALAAYQAVGIHQALVMAEAVGKAPLSALVTVATLVGGTATLLFLAGRVGVPGLAGGGFWLVLSIPWMQDLVFGFADLIAQVRIGAIGRSGFALALGLVAAAVASVVVSATTLREHVRASGGDPSRWSPLLVWPPILAGSLADVLAGLVADRAPGPSVALASRFSEVWILAVCVILPLVMRLQARAIMASNPQEPPLRGGAVVLSLLALVQITICAGFRLLSEESAAFPIQGSALIVVAVVLSAASRTNGATLVGHGSRADD